MHKVVFVKAEIEGFGSIHDSTEFNLGGTTSGITLIKGSNGVGKTTAFSAFCWGLLGKSLKDVTKANVATWVERRTKSFMGTRVMVYFMVGTDYYCVARHVKYKKTTFGLTGGDKLMIFKSTSFVFSSQDLLGDEVHKGDMENFICKLIGASSKVFLNSVVFGQRMKRLVQSTSEEKRKVLEEIFNTDFVNKAKENLVKASEEISTAIANENVNKTRIEHTRQSLQSDAEIDFKRVEQERADMLNLIANYEQSLAFCRTSRKEIEASHDALRQKEISAVKKEQEKRLELDYYIADYEKQNREVATIGKDLQDACAVEEKELAAANDLKNSITKELRGIQVKYPVWSEKALAHRTYWEALNHEDKCIPNQPYSAEDLLAKATTLQNEINAIEKRLMEENYKKTQLDQAIDGKLVMYIRSETEIIDKIRAIDQAQENNHVCDKCSQVVSKSHMLKIENEALDALRKIKETEINECVSNIESAKKCIAKLEKDLKNAVETKTMFSLDLEVGTFYYQENQAIREEKIYNEKEQQLAVCETRIAELHNNLQELRTRIGEMRETAIHRLGKCEAKRNVAQTELTKIVAEKQEIEVDLNNLEQQHARQLEQEAYLEKVLITTKAKEIRFLKDWGQAIASCDAELKACSDRLNNYLALEPKYAWWNKAFGATGLKAHIFGTMVSLINDAAIKYSNVLGLGVKFWVDTTKPSAPFMTTCYMDNLHIDYEELSGGQQQRIDLCLAFALHDVLSTATDINLLVFDEAFEGLDDAGLATCYSFITAKAKTKKVFIISHMNSSSALNAKTIEVTTNNKKHTIYG